MYKASLSLSFVRFVAVISLLGFSSLIVDAQPSTAAAAKPDPLRNLQFRSIGPFRGGRVSAVEGLADNPNVYYFGATGGGVWKTTDGGENWLNISDGFMKTGSVGAIDVADSDPSIIYVGMGEQTLRGNVSSGDGMYKSTDGGKTWKHIGLPDSQQVARIRVHPKNPDLVYAAVLGHLWGKHQERGVFRTRDGGKTWQKILYRNDETGASELAMDPSNPNVLYAGMWHVQRKPWRMDSGGEGSGLFKSTDGGDTWTEITRNRGLPSGPNGKINITVSPVNPNRLWAMIENRDGGGLFLSNDGGDNWQRVSESAAIRQRPWYYNRVYADPNEENTVYVLNVQFHKSIDGGRTFTTIGVPHSDNHDLWISPKDSKRMIEANDGGANVSFNGGGSWSAQDQATAQFYRVTTDNDFPYNIYGAQQDNSTVRIASRSDGGTIGTADWFPVGGGESGWIAPHPDNSNVIFAGSYDGLLTRYDRRSGQERNVDVYPDNPMGSGAEGAKQRFQWNFPIVFSPHKTDGKYALYAASHILFRTYDEGQSWQAISPDLTRNDRSKQTHSGGISGDNTSVEYYDTIFTVDESPLKAGVIWAGTDDGLVQLTQDGGKTWANVTPKDLPEWIQVNHIRASPHDPGSAYFAATNYKNDDLKPYIYKTTDFGRTWKKIVSGIAGDHFTRAVTADPNRRGFLYAGTERGIYYSTNDGETWQSLQLNLPIVPITDLTVHKREKDLVVATQGRSFYVLDNLPVLYQLADARNADAYLFKPEDAYRTAGGGGGPLPATATVGRNPSSGAVINYWLRDKQPKEVSIEFLDASGKSVRKFTKRAESPTGETPPPTAGEPAVPAEAGLNTFVWNYRLPNATTFPGVILWAASLAGPRVPPGTYQVRLTADGKVVGTESFSIVADPRLETTPDGFAKQYELMTKIHAKINDTHGAILDIRDMRTQLETLSRKLKPDQKPLIDMARDISRKMTEVEEALMQTKIRSGQDALNFPIRLNNKLASLAGYVDGADYGPTSQAYTVFNDLTAQIDVQLAKLATIKSTDIAEFNKRYSSAGLPVIISNK